MRAAYDESALPAVATESKSAKRVTNAREDTVLESRFWRSSFEDRRCLVPVTSFSEPKGKKPAIWHWFALDETREPFAFAGLWRHWRGRLKPTADPVEMDVYAFLTTRPNEIVEPIHPTRMPVQQLALTVPTHSQQLPKR